MNIATAQHHVDEAVATLLVAVREAFPAGTAVVVKAGQGTFTGRVSGVAIARNHAVQVQVQRDYGPKDTRRSRPRWHDYRSLRVGP